MPCGLNAQAAALVEAALAHESQEKLARRLGCSGSALSQLRRGRYPAADAARWDARAIEVLGGVDCPALGRLEPGSCEKLRTRAMPMSDPVALRQWRACQNCTVFKGV